ERILKEALSPYFYMVFTGFFYFIVSLCLCLYMGQMKPGLQTIVENKAVFGLSIFTALCYVMGALLVYIAIQMKNASLVGLIEITYPLFTLLFAYLLFRDVQITPWTAAGGMLILSGVAIIAMKG